MERKERERERERERNGKRVVFLRKRAFLCLLVLREKSSGKKSKKKLVHVNSYCSTSTIAL